MITITAFQMVPSFAQGVVRDLRARWALEEAGLPYEVRLVDPTILATPEYRAQQPFGQVPVLTDDGLTLFESGSILLHIAQRSEVLLPKTEKERARAISWVFAALNSIEPFAQRLAELDFFYPGQEWPKQHRPDVVNMARRRLSELATWLGDRDFLESRFTAGDLMMTTVLRILRHTDLVAEQPRLAAYQSRCESRPAFQRALQGQMSAFQRAA